MSPWTIRAARVDDRSTIAAHRYFRGEPASDVEAYATWIAEKIRTGGYLGLVAERDGAIVGGAGVVLLDFFSSTPSSPVAIRR